MKRILFAAALLLSGAQFAYGQTADAFINGAKARMSKNKWEDARKVLAEQIGNYPDNAEMHYLYSIALAKVSPDSNPKAIEHLAIADSLNGNPGAEDELQASIDQALTALWGPMVNDGVRLLSLGDIEGAEVKLVAAVEINPQGKEGRLGLGALHQAKKEYDLAIEQYNAAVEIDPAYKQALIRLGQTYQLKAEEASAAGNTQQAEQLAAKAAAVFDGYLAENPDDIEVKIQLAGLHAALGNMEKAEPIIRQVMTADSVSVDVYSDFGFALANAEQYDLAEEVLLKAVELSDSLNSEAISYLAFVRIQKKDLEGAKPILLKQIELEPDNYEAWEYLGFVLRDLGDSSGAQDAFSKAEAIPLELDALRMSQQSDRTWNVQATFSNRQEAPVQDIKIKFMLVSTEGEIIETKEASLAEQPLAAGEAEEVTIEFSTPADSPRVRYDIL
ncbi:MAG: tetratricopeptide repeat protein [Gemmatimonadetes bacterium]|nr:tetratricopeptide repeat protein [Gemmatimonadota bacterium]